MQSSGTLRDNRSQISEEMTKIFCAAELQAELRETLLLRHGPILGGKPLAVALGYRSVAAFRQARRRGQITVPLFIVPHRQGWFALTQDVADWLTCLRLASQRKEADQNTLRTA
jgi:hypothetical protein